jgi:cell division protein FtsZ
MMTDCYNRSIKVVGIGGAGINVVGRLVKEPLPNGTEVIAIDADGSALSITPVKNRVLLDVMPFKRGIGGPMPSELMRAYTASLDTIREAFKETGYVILVAGLGGVTGSTVATLIAALLKEQGIPSLGIFNTPFSFEGERRLTASEDAIYAVKHGLNTFFVFLSMDIIKVAGEKISLKDAYTSLDDLMSRVLCSLLRAFPYPQTCRSMSFVQMMASGVGGVGCIGIGTGSGENRAMDALNNAIHFMGEERYKKASMIALILEGDNELRIDQVGEVYDRFQNMADLSAEFCPELIIQDSAGRKSMVTLLAAGFPSKKSAKFRGMENHTD